MGRHRYIGGVGSFSEPVYSGGVFFGMTPPPIEAAPVTLREANAFVEQFHRHSGRTSRDGGKFAIAAEVDGMIVGIAIVGRPVARLIAQDRFAAEVLRTCVSPDAPRNVNSFLYGACWRAWRAMGGKRLVTYTLQSESGESLRGAGWKILAEVKGSPDGWNRKGRRREWKPIYGQQKLRWEVILSGAGDGSVGHSNKPHDQHVSVGASALHNAIIGIVAYPKEAK